MDAAAVQHCPDNCDGSTTSHCEGVGHALKPDGYEDAVQRARRAVKDAIISITPAVAGIDSTIDKEFSHGGSSAVP